MDPVGDVVAVSLLSKNLVDLGGKDARPIAPRRVHPCWVANAPGNAGNRDAIGDEARPRSAQCDQLVGIHGEIGGIQGLAVDVRCAVFEEVPGHPMVFALVGKIFHGFAKVVAMWFGAAFTGRTDERNRDARVKCLGDKGRLAVARYAFDAHLLRIHFGIRVGFEVVDQLADAPLPGAEGTPLIRRARLAFVGQTDDSKAQVIPAAIGLDAARINRAVTPAGADGGLGNARKPATATATSATAARGWRVGIIRCGRRLRYLPGWPPTTKSASRRSSAARPGTAASSATWGAAATKSA